MFRRDGDFLKMCVAQLKLQPQLRHLSTQHIHYHNKIVTDLLYMLSKCYLAYEN